MYKYKSNDIKPTILIVVFVYLPETQQPLATESDSDVRRIVESVLDQVLDMAVEIIQKNQLLSKSKPSEIQGEASPAGEPSKEQEEQKPKKEEEDQEFEYKVGFVFSVSI